MLRTPMGYIGATKAFHIDVLISLLRQRWSRSDLLQRLPGAASGPAHGHGPWLILSKDLLRSPFLMHKLLFGVQNVSHMLSLVCISGITQQVAQTSNARPLGPQVRQKKSISRSSSICVICFAFTAPAFVPPQKSASHPTSARVWRRSPK